MAFHLVPLDTVDNQIQGNKRKLYEILFGLSDKIPSDLSQMRIYWKNTQVS